VKIPKIIYQEILKIPKMYIYKKKYFSAQKQIPKTHQKVEKLNLISWLND